MEPKIIPIYHASFILDWGGKIIYVDPAWDKKLYEDKPKPDLVLITDIHFDHLDNNVLESLSQKGDFDLIVPKAVYDDLLEKLKPKAKILNNEEEMNWNDFKVTALPMYNLTPERSQFHPKGRGNGYLIEKDDFRVYIAGDTEDIPEMKNLKNIDLAFVPMNLPYTMDVEQAVSVVLEFQPKKIYPYHYRGENGFSDVNKFKELVEKENKNIEVILAKWY
ncbi:MAG: metal-dependent hydrolase [Candidatus Parcubacteria bacterium]|nr:MAG: metal-dependent hydrolase [Candidatus Parcubacteria bacterium]